MKEKTLYILGLIVFLSSGQMISAQTAADYDALSMKPGLYEGISEATSETEALFKAETSAYRTLAGSICSFVTGRTDVEMIVKGTNQADVIVTITGNTTVVVRLPLTGVEQIGKKIERTEVGYKVRVLITISKEGRLKAEKYVSQETTAFRVYQYFTGKFNLSPAVLTGVPSGYYDYSSWLENNCLIFSMKSGGNEFLVPLDTFLRKLNRSIEVFSDNYDGKSVRIVFNTPDRSLEIVTALHKSRIKVSRENSRLLLSPDISLNEFRIQVETMPDAGKMVITGISSYENRNSHISPLALNEAALAGQNFGITAEAVRLPEQCLNGTYNDMQIINMLSRKTARYIFLLKLTSIVEPGIELYRIPPHYRITYIGILYDSLTEKYIYGDTINDIEFSSPVGIGGGGRITTGLREMINSVLRNL